jgi:hypothetical protein
MRFPIKRRLRLVPCGLPSLEKTVCIWKYKNGICVVQDASLPEHLKMHFGTPTPSEGAADANEMGEFARRSWACEAMLGQHLLRIDITTRRWPQ